MGWLPKSLKARLILRLLVEAVDEVDAATLGRDLNALMDRQAWGQPASNKAQARLAAWLQDVATALRA